MCIESSRNHQTNCFCDGDLCNDAKISLSHFGIIMLVVAVTAILNITWW